MSTPAEICAGLASIANKYALETSSQPSAEFASIVAALENFMECVRYLNTRRSGGAILSLESEADVQDAIYLMLRPWVSDLIPEDPTGRIGNRYTIKDFISVSARTIVEAKFIRDKEQGKSVSKELHDDIETYRHHPQCDNIIFFVYDPDTYISDCDALKRAIHAARSYDGHSLNVLLIVKP
jgi:hypothetical protein